MEMSEGKRKRLITLGATVVLCGVAVGAWFVATKIAEVGYRSPAVEESVQVADEEEDEVTLTAPKELRYDGRKDGTSDISDFGVKVANPYNNDSEFDYRILNELGSYSPEVKDIKSECSYLSRGYFLCGVDGSVYSIVDAQYQRLFAVASQGAIDDVTEKNFIEMYPEAYYAQGAKALDGWQILQRGTVQDLTFGGNKNE